MASIGTLLEQELRRVARSAVKDDIGTLHRHLRELSRRLRVLEQRERHPTSCHVSMPL